MISLNQAIFEDEVKEVLLTIQMVLCNYHTSLLIGPSKSC